MIKIKHNPTKNLYAIKGLSMEHLQVILELVSNTNCGAAIYENAVFEICNAFDTSDIEIEEGTCSLSVEASWDNFALKLTHSEDM